MIYLLGSIPLGIEPLTGPVAHNIEHTATFAQHGTTRGKPALQEIGEELDTQSFGFFFSEEFCDPAAELAKLEAAFDLKSPLPLVLGNGGFGGSVMSSRACPWASRRQTVPVRPLGLRRRSVSWKIQLRADCSRF